MLLCFVRSQLLSVGKRRNGLIKKWRTDTLLALLHQAQHMNEPLTNVHPKQDCQNKHSQHIKAILDEMMLMMLIPLYLPCALFSGSILTSTHWYFIIFLARLMVQNFMLKKSTIFGGDKAPCQYHANTMELWILQGVTVRVFVMNHHSSVNRVR